MSETYQEYQATLKAEQSSKSKEEIQQELAHKSEYTFDLDNFPSVDHNWVQRGIKVSCEGANHPHHSHFLKRA